VLLTERFAAVVARHPDAIAIDVPEGEGRPQRVRVRYDELAAMAAVVRDRLAPFVRGECFVVVLLARTTAWLYAAQIAVLQAGAAHVCLDVAFPDEHLRQVAQSCRPVAVITDEAGAARVRAFGAEVVVVRDAMRGGEHANAAAAQLAANRLAYAIYTSGTTGVPKGVLLEHGGIANLIARGIERFRLGPGDRVAQGSSPAYDSSLEETWLALGSGGTVVVLDEQTVRLGPDLAPWLRRERVTVLCPPPTLLRAMGCRSPARELPDLRLCYVGGEALPADLAETWGRDLWLENGYGPTECTVTVLRGRVRPGEPVTIGRPVEPNVAVVLDADLRPVADGEPGELCIAGPGVARGYLGDDERTAQRFPTVPGVGRCYRTGDSVVRRPDGEFEFHGRIDAQVKLRGYRIELEAIEAVLAREAAVREAVCTVEGDEPARILVAHVVPAAKGASIDGAALASAVRAALPAYMVPARFVPLAEVPRTVGGKVDRKRLPRVLGAAERHEVPAAAVEGAEAALQREFAAVLGLDPMAVGRDDDFFALGGDSLRAALLVSRLRGVGEFAALAVRDVYAAPTVRRIAAVASARQGRTAAGGAASAAPQGGRPIVATMVQTIVLLLMLVVGASIGYGAAFVGLPAVADGASLPFVLLGMPWLLVGLRAVLGAVALWLGAAAKELLIGRYERGEHPVWGGFFVRHWIVVRLVRLAPWGLVAGTELQCSFLRLLGARIGRRVHLNRGVDLTGGGWDLLTIGDDVTLQREVDLGLCELDAGRLVVGPVRLGDGCVLATRAGTGRDVEVGDDAIVEPLSFVGSGASVPPRTRVAGVPAAPVGDAGEPPPAGVGTAWRHALLVVLGRLCWQPLAELPFFGLLALGALAAGIDAAEAVAWLCGDGPWSEPAWLAVTLVLSVLAVPCSVLLRALVLRFTPRVPVGSHRRGSAWHVHATFRGEQLEAAGAWLTGTLLWPWWLRLAGMRIGRDSEVSTILDVLPEHLSLGGGSFLADGVYLGVPAERRGVVTWRPASLGERTFVGNHVVVPGGESLPDDLVLGVSTVADAARMPADSGWFGQPSFRLPRREVVEVDRRFTHEPGPLRYTNRLGWECARFLLPLLPTAAGLWWFDAVAGAAAGHAWWAAVLATALVAFVLVAAVLLTKWLLLGRVRPGQHGLWSCWASRWDFHYVLWQRWGRALLLPFEGTLLLPFYLRAMGMRIGRRCVLGDGFAQVVDPDMITIEDGATVHALFQAHSFEDRVLKIDHVRIGRGATVGRAAVVLYGADIGDGAWVSPHSVVMKRERLLPGRAYAGAPVVEVAAANLAGASPAADRVIEGRDEALDAARGLAVLGMIGLHFVPEPAADDAGAVAAAVRWGLGFAEGVPAALFALLAGAAWVTARYRPAEAVRRALALAAVGVPFWVFVWPNDVLTPLAIMLPFVLMLHRAGRGAVVAAIGLLLVAVPVLREALGDWLDVDLLDDGTHLANHGFGMATLRYFVFDGAYPLVPWLVLPLLGALLARVERTAAVARRWWWLALPLPFVAAGFDAVAAMELEGLDPLAPHLAVQWQPTSLPFVLRGGGVAVAVVALLRWRAAVATAPGRVFTALARVGRLSFTLYLAHIVFGYVLLRRWWPDEDWSVAVGVVMAVVWWLLAFVSAACWLRRWPRGPLEALLRWSCGR
jgi:non-ribosomal peptide synthetase-like protein